MNPENEIAENLRDAGCTENDIQSILARLQTGDMKRAGKLIAQCRKRQLDRLHDSQRCIDRLDFLSCQLAKV